MASSKRVKLHYTLCESVLPENMGADHAGEFWIAKAEQSVWFVAKNGAVVSISDFLLNAELVAPPRHGRDGRDAEPAPKGERGERGPAGKDAQPAKDGRDGVGIVGPQGIPGSSGRDGRDAPQRVEFDNLLRDFKALRAEFTALSQDFYTLSLAFTSASNKTSDYLAFLEKRAADRIASGNVKK
jgi:hypothetical protein